MLDKYYGKNRKQGKKRAVFHESKLKNVKEAPIVNDLYVN
jgi:hypothetical protein